MRGQTAKSHTAKSHTGKLTPTIPNTGYPVLTGLEKAGVSGKHIAILTAVSAPTVSKWRSGNSVMPAVTVAFLTLVLASLIEDMEALERRLEEEGCAWNDMFGDQLRDLQALLREQEIYNAAHPPAVIREGAALFRAWLVMSDGLPTTMTNRNDYTVIKDHMTAPAAE